MKKMILSLLLALSLLWGAAEAEGIVSEWVQQAELCAPMLVTHFDTDIPETIRELCAIPALEGWQPVRGAYGAYEEQADQERYKGEQTGLIALEKGAERLLVLMKRDADGAWRLYSMGTRALLPERAFSIVGNPTELGYQIVYPLTETCSEIYTLRVKDDSCTVRQYSRMDEQTGAGIEINVDQGCLAVSEYGEGGDLLYRETMLKPQIPLLHLMDMSAFPTTVEACQALEYLAAPEGYGVACSVHLRAQTSSRSADLGKYNAGTLVEILGMADGDPFDWYKVRIGSVEGYMSSNYVDYNGSVCAMHPFGWGTLPVGEAVENTQLKTGKGLFGTGLFAGTVQELPAGTRMHLLAERGDWLHVMIPSGEIGWMMDTNGVDGYVRKDAIREISMTALPMEKQE